MARLGILGTGELAGFLVRGLHGAGHQIILSPRNAEKAREIAAKFGTTVAADNQEVIDASDAVIVCLPAATGLAVLRGLRFRAGQHVLSVMAGAGPASVAAAVSPAGSSVAMMPGHANALHLGPVLLHPRDGWWEPVLSALGPVTCLDDASEFTAGACFGAVSGASFHWMAALIDWFVTHGIAPDTARHLVAATLAGNAAVLMREDTALHDIVQGVATPGGITAQAATILQDQGALDAWRAALDAVHERLAGSA